MEKEKEEEIRTYLAKNSLKWVGRLTASVNKMDGRCRQLLLTDPKRPLTDYCQKCQKILKKAMESA